MQSCSDLQFDFLIPFRWHFIFIIKVFFIIAPCDHQNNGIEVVADSHHTLGTYALLSVIDLLKFQVKRLYDKQHSWADPKGGQVVRPPPLRKNKKNIGFLSITGPDP